MGQLKSKEEVMSFLGIPAASATKVPKERVKHQYHMRQTGVLIATCLSYASFYIIRQVVQDEEIPLRHQYGFSVGEIGIILSAFGIGYGISKFIMGFVADRVSMKRFLILALYGSAIANLFFAWTRSCGVMIVLMLINSVFQGVGAPVCQREVSLWFAKRSRGTAYAIWSAAHNFGAFFCVVTIEAAAAAFSGSISAIFITSSIVAAVIGTLMYLINSERPETYGLPDINTYSNSVELNENGNTTAGSVTKKSVWQVFLRDILCNKMVWAVSLASMSFYICRYGILSWIPSYLPTKGFSANTARWIVGEYELFLIPAVIFFGFVSDLLKGRRALVTFCLTIVMICALCLYFFAPDKALILVGLFISGACIYAPLDLVGLMVNEAVPKYAVGISTGFMGFFQYIFGDTIATALIGELVDRFGWGASSVVIFIAGGLCFIISLYLTYSERHIINMEKRANSLTPAEKAALEDPLSADEDVLRAAEAKVKGKKKAKK